MNPRRSGLQRVAGREGTGMADGAPGGLDEGRLEPAVAVARARRASLAGTLVQTWAESGPGDEVTGRGEVAHVDADLGDQDMGGRVADAPDGGQAGEGGTGSSVAEPVGLG